MYLTCHHRDASPLVADLCGRQHDFDVDPISLSDLGARIVASALADEFLHRYEDAAQHGFGNCTAAGERLSDTENDLRRMAHGEDDESEDRSRENWLIHERAWG